MEAVMCVSHVLVVADSRFNMLMVKNSKMCSNVFTKDYSALCLQHSNKKRRKTTYLYEQS